jgi:RNA polymerase sigma factor (sigma-70 family)
MVKGAGPHRSAGGGAEAVTHAPPDGTKSSKVVPSATAEPSDEELVRRIQADPRGEAAREAASRLFGRYLDPVFGWCYRWVRDRERAMDLAQDVLAAAWESLPRFQGDSRLGTWLYAIARHKCWNAMRPTRREWVRDLEEDMLVDGGPSPDEMVGLVQEEERARRLFEDVLLPVESTAMWLRCFEGLEVEEITRLLDIRGASGARGVLQTARRKLRAVMARRYERS